MLAFETKLLGFIPVPAQAGDCTSSFLATQSTIQSPVQTANAAQVWQVNVLYSSFFWLHREYCKHLCKYRSLPKCSR